MSDAEKDKRDTKIAFGCVFLFLTPFFIAGVAVLISGLIDLSNGSDFSDDVIAKLGAGSMFSFVASCFLALFLIGYRRASEESELKAQYPDEPWKWRQEWLEGRMQSSNIGAMIVTGLFGLTFGGAGVLILYKLDEIVEDGPLGYVSLLFPLVGFGMLAGFVYCTLQWLKYRNVHLDLVTNPGVIGGWFQAILWADIRFGANDKVEAQLKCYYRRSGSGDNDNGSRLVKWQEDIVDEQDRMMVEADGTYAIPIKMWVPRDCAATTPGSPTDRYEWELSAQAEVSGIDFSATFIVPMFETEESRDAPPPNVEELSIGADEQPYHPTILVTEGISSLKLHAPPRRNPGVLFSITFFWLIWTAICIGLFYSDAPLLFPIVFSFFDLLLTYGVVWSWFGAVSLNFDHDMLSIDKTILGFGRRHFLDLKEITGVDMNIDMQSGDKPYYTLRLHHGGKHTSAFGGLASKREVEDLIAQIEKYITKQR